MHGKMREDDEKEMLSRIMTKRSGTEMCHACGGAIHKYSEGGQVANDTPDIADFADNDFDDLVLRDSLESSYTGSNSGDEIGNATHDEEDEDLISRIMRSRAKKDRLPRPA